MPWEIRQLTGDYFLPLLRCFEAFGDPSLLYQMGVDIDCDMSDAVANDELLHIEWNKSEAKLIGGYTLQLVAMRLRRGLPLLKGWPRRCVLALDARFEQTILGEYKQDLDNFNELSARSDPTAKAMAKRSLFNAAHVQNYTGMFVATGFQMTPQLRDALARRHSRLISTQVLEDGFNVERRATDHCSNEAMSNDRMWSTLTHKEVLTQRHSYDEVDWRAQAKTREVTLPTKVARLWRPNHSEGSRGRGGRLLPQAFSGGTLTCEPSSDIHKSSPPCMGAPSCPKF